MNLLRNHAYLRMKMKTTIFLFSSLLAFNASAQMMVESTMLGQTLTTTKQGKVSACGIRVVGMPKPVKGANQRMFDASLNITANAAGIAKVIASTGPLTGDFSSMKPVKIYGAWFKVKGLEAVAPLKGFIPGETPNSNLFIADPTKSAQTIGAMSTGEQTQIAVSWQKGLETIYFGTVELNEVERQLLLDCFNQLK